MVWDVFILDKRNYSKLLESAKSKRIELEGPGWVYSWALMHSCFHGFHLIEETIEHSTEFLFVHLVMLIWPSKQIRFRTLFSGCFRDHE